jgi:hypothetical protein
MAPHEYERPSQNAALLRQVKLYDHLLQYAVLSLSHIDLICTVPSFLENEPEGMVVHILNPQSDPVSGTSKPGAGAVLPQRSRDDSRNTKERTSYNRKIQTLRKKEYPMLKGNDFEEIQS